MGLRGRHRRVAALWHDQEHAPLVGVQGLRGTRSRNHACRAIARTFHCFGGLRFAEDTCFVLPADGLEFARQAGAAEDTKAALQSVALEPQRNETCRVPAADPTWDPSRQQLRVGRVVVKQFKVPAVNQELILAAFEEEGRPSRIDDPLPFRLSEDAKRRVHDTIKSLNRHPQHPLLHFLGDNSGMVLRWRLLKAGEYGHAATSETPTAISSNGNGQAFDVPNLPR